MNIFVLDECPKLAAEMLCDKHVVSQVKETAQMLAAVAHRYGADPNTLPLTKGTGTPMKNSYPNHPCTLWAGETYENYSWLAAHGLAIAKQKTLRFGTPSFCEKQIRSLVRIIETLPLPQTGQTEHAVAIRDDKRCRKVRGFDKLDAVGQYRMYYIYDKPFAKWQKLQNRPEWMFDCGND